MTSPFIGEFCEVRELQEGGKEGGRGHQQQQQQKCGMFFI